MFDWICHNRDLFLLNYVEIGHSYQLAKQLQEEHQRFSMSSMNVYVNINRILSVATRLMEGGHYAATHIGTVARRLERTWKGFADGLEERTAVLALSVIFHHKAEQYVDNVTSWIGACESNNIPTEIIMLENAIHQHQNLYESMCQAYTEVRKKNSTYFENSLQISSDSEIVVCNQTNDIGRCLRYSNKYVHEFRENIFSFILLKSVYRQLFHTNCFIYFNDSF